MNFNSCSIRFNFWYRDSRSDFFLPPNISYGFSVFILVEFHALFEEQRIDFLFAEQVSQASAWDR